MSDNPSTAPATGPMPDKDVISSARRIENEFDKGDPAFNGAYGKLIDEFNGILTKYGQQYGDDAARRIWTQIGTDDTANHDNVQPYLAMEWGGNALSGYAYAGQYSESDFSQTTLQRLAQMPFDTGPGKPSFGDQEIAKLSADYLGDPNNFSKYAEAPGFLLSRDVDPSSLDKQAGWNAPKTADSPSPWYMKVLQDI